MTQNSHITCFCFVYFFGEGVGGKQKTWTNKWKEKYLNNEIKLKFITLYTTSLLQLKWERQGLFGMSSVDRNRKIYYKLEFSQLNYSVQIPFITFTMYNSFTSFQNIPQYTHCTCAWFTATLLASYTTERPLVPPCFIRSLQYQTIL